MDTLQWSAGPNLPRKCAYGVSVPFEDTFLVVGGYSSVSLDQILQFDQETETWITRTEKLATGRHYFAAFMVPDNAVKCN